MEHIRDLTSRRHQGLGFLFTRRGFLLLPVLVVTGGLVLLGAEGLLRSQLELVAAERLLAKHQALALAEGRLDEIVTAIAADPVTASQWTSCPPPSAATLGTTTCTMGPLSGTFVDGPGGVIKQEVQITVSGLVPDAVNPQGRQTVEVVVAVPVGTIFDKGAYGNFVTLNEGTRVDSYDSSTPLAPPGSSATIQSGATSSNGIALFRSQVFGDAFVAPGSSIVCYFEPCVITGVQGIASPPTIPPVRMLTGTPSGPALTSCPGGALTFDVSSFPYSNIKLSEPCDITFNGDGTLFFQTTNRVLPLLNYFTLPAGSRLTVNGRVQVVADKLYFGDDFNGPTVVLGADASFTAYTRYQSRVRGDINNPASGSLGRPRDFTVYAGLSGAPLGEAIPASRTGGTYYGTFFEGSRLLLPTGQTFGSLIARSNSFISNSWSQIHQDLSLKNEGAVVSPTNPIRRRSWRIL
ncbi:MAG: hypothetical protein HYY90_03595 [Candidatus Omnitrophica bacterium]|nr:hypothetical protein [Candidatus Omnitrophota bacterium]